MKIFNQRMTSFLRNFSYSFCSNVISTIISAIVVLVLPRTISVEEYGYYQLYLFYIHYVGVLYFGWCDGIYLRIGGQYYDNLNKPLYNSQFWLLGLFETIIYLIIFVSARNIVTDADKLYVIGCTCIVAVGMCLRWFLTFIMQATARIREYAYVTILERCIVLVIVLVLLLTGERKFYRYVVADIFAKYISLILGMWYCRDIIKAHRVPLREAVSEIHANMAAGIKLMFASLCSMLIVGVIRFGIESHWDIATFGRVSLTLSISGLVVTMIESIAVVLYPMLCRVPGQQMLKLYAIMRTMLMGVIFGIFMFYYPFRLLISYWLPQYLESLRYMAILFPICAYESKMSMLINTYYKSLRLENQLMKCNMAAFALSFMSILLATTVLNSMTFAVVSILICIVFRGVISELVLERRIGIHVKKDIIIELAMTVAFIICNWFFGFAGMVAYVGFYMIYLAVNKNNIIEVLSFVKSMR